MTPNQREAWLMLTPQQRARLRRKEFEQRTHMTRVLMRVGWDRDNAEALANEPYYAPFPFETIEDGT